MARSRVNAGVKVNRDSDVAYQKVQKIAEICKESKTLIEAKDRARKEVAGGENLDAMVAAIGYWLK